MCYLRGANKSAQYNKTFFPEHCLHVTVRAELSVFKGLSTPRASALTGNNELRIGIIDIDVFEAPFYFH